MAGARRDLAGRFRSADDIRAILFGGASIKRPSGPSELLMKGTDEDDWRPLVAGASRA